MISRYLCVPLVLCAYSLGQAQQRLANEDQAAFFASSEVIVALSDINQLTCSDWVDLSLETTSVDCSEASITFEFRADTESAWLQAAVYTDKFGPAINQPYLIASSCSLPAFSWNSSQDLGTGIANDEGQIRVRIIQTVTSEQSIEFADIVFLETPPATLPTLNPTLSDGVYTRTFSTGSDIVLDNSILTLSMGSVSPPAPSSLKATYTKLEGNTEISTQSSKLSSSGTAYAELPIPSLAASTEESKYSLIVKDCSESLSSVEGNFIVRELHPNLNSITKPDHLSPQF